MIISFGTATPALLAGLKTATVREWSPMTIRSIQAAWDGGRRVHRAYDRLPIRGGRQIGWIRLTGRPRLKRLGDFSLEEIRAEGLGIRSRAEWLRWIGSCGWHPHDEVLLLRFRFRPWPKR